MVFNRTASVTVTHPSRRQGVQVLEPRSPAGAVSAPGRAGPAPLTDHVLLRPGVHHDVCRRLPWSGRRAALTPGRGRKSAPGAGSPPATVPGPSGLSSGDPVGNAYPRGPGTERGGVQASAPNQHGVACPRGRRPTLPAAPPARSHLSHEAAPPLRTRLPLARPPRPTLAPPGSLPVAHALSLPHPLSSTPASRRSPSRRPRAHFAEGN